MVKRYLKYTFIFLGLLITVGLLLGVGLLSWQKTRVQKAIKITNPQGIEVLETVTLGDLNQWVSIRGTYRDNPVLLFLHGGPGGAALPRLRHYNPELEEHFVVVVWEQRGAGKSYSADIPPESMEIKQFVADTLELTEVLQKRFEKEQIFLMGHSWGSVLGILAASQQPQHYHAFVGVGQGVNFRKSGLISYQYTLEKAYEAGHVEAIEELEALGSPPFESEDFYEKIRTQNKWLNYFSEEVYRSGGISLSAMLLYAPEYTLRENLQLAKANEYSARALWDELMTVDLKQQAPELDLPVYILHGRHDYITSWELAESYFEHLEVPIKKLFWFENSAHNPMLEEREKFYHILIDEVLPKGL